MTKDNVIVFPTDRIKNKDKVIVDKKQVQEQYTKIEQQQTKQFVETAVDDIAIMLCKTFLDLQIRTSSAVFTRDLALLIDVLRGLIYRDFNIKHPSQVMSEKMVELRTLKDGSQSARINYDIFNKGKTVPLSPEVRNEIKEGPGIFEPDGDLDK